MKTLKQFLAKSQLKSIVENTSLRNSPILSKLSKDEKKVLIDLINTTYLPGQNANTTNNKVLANDGNLDVFLVGYVRDLLLQAEMESRRKYTPDAKKKIIAGLRQKFGK
jgi:hypothetical protein